jgi:hypothetical protein
MRLSDLISQIAGFNSLKPRDKIRLFAWFLHRYRNIGVFDNASIRECFREIDEVPVDVSVYMPRMASKKPPDLIRVRGGYKLEGKVRRLFDQRYGEHQSVVAVKKLLADLPSKIPNLDKRAFLSEAIDCYRVKAYRAAIVMAWNLAFDHLVEWIVSDSHRIAQFNSAIPRRFPKMTSICVSTRADFEEIKESEVIEICNTAKLVSRNVIAILKEKLGRRNRAAHPSGEAITQAQADDVITDLVNNVVLNLK